MMRPAVESAFEVPRTEAEEMCDEEGDARSPTGAAIEGEGSDSGFDFVVDDALCSPASGYDFEVWGEAL